MKLILGVLCLIAAGSRAAILPETKEVKLARASNDLAFDLLKSYQNEKNVFISPFSISTALALVYLGTDGTTSQAMRTALNYDRYGLSFSDVLGAYSSVLTRIKQNSGDYKLSTYNGVLVQKDFIILHMYGHAVQQYYSANIASVDFANEGEQVKAKINADVERVTNGQIKDFLDKPPSSDTQLFLLNAVYFLGNWEKPFDPEWTREGTFYNNGNAEKKVQMMHRDGRYQYSTHNDLEASIVVLPYKGEGSASMVIVLPDEKTGVAALQQKLTQESLGNALKKSRVGTIDLSLPKFSLQYSAELTEPLERLGLAEIFSDRANFFRLVGPQQNIKVSSVVHKAVIDVNEKGSEASAATGIEITNKSLPPSVDVDHPFLFFIVDDTTGMILFSGRVDEL